MKNILKRKIGIAGCGTMGLPMLKVLLKKQISATGYDIKPKKNFKSINNNFGGVSDRVDNNNTINGISIIGRSQNIWWLFTSIAQKVLEIGLSCEI